MSSTKTTRSPIVEYAANTTFFTKFGTDHERGDLYLYENKVIGFLSDGERKKVVLGIRTFNKLHDDLAYITLPKVKPNMQGAGGIIANIHIVALRTTGKRGIQNDLAPAYIGLHTFGTAYADPSLLDQIYQTSNTFRNITDLTRITPKQIDTLLQKKRAPFDGVNKNGLENIACANGHTYVLLLERKK